MGLGVFVHMAAVAVFMLALMVAWAAGEGLQAEKSKNATSNRNGLGFDLRFII